MDANSARQLQYLWKWRHKHDGDTTQQQIKVITNQIGELTDQTVASGTGAFLHVNGGAAQTIAVGGEAVEWSELGVLEYFEFEAPTFPVTQITIPKDGYYNVAVLLEWDSWTDGGEVWVVRTRDGEPLTVWPPVNTGWWTATAASRFIDVAQAIRCRVGDILEVFVDHGDGSTQDLAAASAAFYLVDRHISVIEPTPDPDPPAEVPTDGMILRLEPPALEAIYNDTDPIDLWTDTSGENNDAVGPPTSRPLVEANSINGMASARFDAGRHLRLPLILSGSTPADFFMLAKVDNDPSTTGGGGIWRIGADGNADHYPFTDGVFYCGLGTTARKNTGNPTRDLTQWTLINVSTDTNDYNVRLHNTLHYNTATNTVGWYGVVDWLIGSWTSTYFMLGNIAAVLMYDRVLTSTERTAVWDYFVETYDV